MRQKIYDLVGHKTLNRMLYFVKRYYLQILTTEIFNKMCEKNGIRSSELMQLYFYFFPAHKLFAKKQWKGLEREEYFE